MMLAVAPADPEGHSRVDIFRRALDDAGWTDGRDVSIEVGWYHGNLEKARQVARELVAGGSEVLVVNGTPGMDAVRELKITLPVVFNVVSNPVGAGYVPNLSRPGANITGFSTFEPEIAGKWLQIIRQIAPGLRVINMLLDPKFTNFTSLWQSLEEIAPRQGVRARRADVSSLAEIEWQLTEISRQEQPALIVAPSPVNTVNRIRIFALAQELRIPAIYPFRFYLRDGALVTYGFNVADQFKRTAGYVARILAGETAGELPVQLPSVFELGINLKVAKAMGLSIPQSLLIAADEIAE